MERLQQAVSRKKKGSKNRRKAVARVAQCHRRIAAIRRDFLHQETTRLVRDNNLLAVEDLQVKGMTASAAGTIQAPGKNVGHKAGPDRSMLKYKAAWRGATLVAVPPAFTSQTCSPCGHVAAQNRLSQGLFECAEGGRTENADRNAARNILLRAKEVLAGAGLPSTAGYAGPHACSGGPNRSKPCSAAQAGAVGLVLAKTVSELDLAGNLHP